MWTTTVTLAAGMTIPAMAGSDSGSEPTPSTPSEPTPSTASDRSGRGSKKNDGVGVKVSFVPIPMLRFDQGRGIINMGPIALVAGRAGKTKSQILTKKISQDIHQSHKSEYCPDSQRIVLTPASKCDRYKVVDHRKHAFGLGVGVVANITGGGAAGGLFSFGGAALPMYGKSVTAERFVRSYKKAKNLDKPYIPKSADEVKKWAIGDSLSYTTQGGIMLFAGAQFAGAGAFMPVHIKGDWGVFLQKLSKREFLYSIHRLKTISASLLIGHTLLGRVGPDVGASLKKTYSFKLDIKHPKAREQFRRLMRGRLTDAQKLANDPEAKFLYPFKRLRRVNKSIGLKARYGFPVVLRKIWAIKRSSSDTTEHSFEDDRDVKVHEVTVDRFSTMRQMRNIFKKENRNHKFKHSARHQIARGSTRDDHSRKSKYAEIIWSYSNDVARKKNLTKAMHRIKSFTGLTGQVDVQWDGEDSLGYLGIYFKLPLYLESLKYLHRFLDSDHGEDEMLMRGSQQINTYFEDRNDPGELCSSSLLKKHCVSGYRKDTRSAIESLHRNLNRFFAEGHELKETAKILSNIASDISKTPFVMQTVINLSKRHFVASYRVNGEKFRPVDVRIMLARP